MLTGRFTSSKRSFDGHSLNTDLFGSDYTPLRHRIQGASAEPGRKALLLSLC